jgi:hypothetical protein
MPVDSLEVAVELPPEPYPGLRPFEPSEWAIFFGREKMIDEVTASLAESHLVVVHGSSGCGKSSLVRAGVLPWLGLDHARSGKSWITTTMRPSGGPLKNLAKCLAKQLTSPVTGCSDSDYITGWHDLLALGSDALDEVEGVLAKRRGASLCLLIDQFEELFRWAHEQSREEAQLLVDLLGSVMGGRSPHLFVILTMRSDFLGQCAQFEGFAEVVNRCQYLLPRMDDLSLLRAIHEPAVLYGGKINSAVGDHLLFGSRQQEDALPVLQHSLMRACSYARATQGQDERWTVTLADVKAVEGEHGALSEHAGQILAEVAGNDAERLRATEWVFPSLVDVDDRGRVLRRPRRIGELSEIAGCNATTTIEIIEAFRSSGRTFLTPYPPEPLDVDSEINVSHEALIRRWDKISGTLGTSGWLSDELRDGQRYRTLVELLPGPLPTRQTKRWTDWWDERQRTSVWAERYGGRYGEIEKMLASSRVRARLRWLGAAMLFVFLLVGWQYFQERNARVVAENEVAKLTARIKEIAVASFLRLLDARDLGSSVRSLAVLADGRLAGGGEDGKIKLWPKEGAGEPVVLSQGSPVLSLAVLSDGRLASGGEDGKIKLWPKEGMGEPVVLSQSSPVQSLAVLADGRLASGGRDGQIKLWPKEGMGEPVVLSQGSPVLSLAVLSDGRLASGGEDGKIKLWPKEGTGDPVVLSQGSPVQSLAVLADGRLASGGRDGQIKLWPGTGEPVVLAQGSAVSSLAVLSDGRLASGGFDRQITLWPKEGTGDPVVLSQGSAVLSLAELVDEWLASGGSDGKIKLWLTNQDKLIAALCRAGRNVTPVEWARYIGSDIPWQPSCLDVPEPVNPRDAGPYGRH